MTRKVLAKIEYLVYPEDDSPHEAFDNMKDAVTYAQECGLGSEIAIHTDVREHEGENSVRSLSIQYVVKIMRRDTDPWITDRIFR